MRLRSRSTEPLLAVLLRAIVGLLMLSPLAASAQEDDSAAARRGALVDQVVFTEDANPGKVVGQIETGARHVLAQGITSPVLLRQIRNAPRVDYALSYGSSAELTLNPAGPELENGELNPFAVPAIREALNWLVDREYIASELYGGLAEPRTLPLSTAFPDYARLAPRARALELEYAYQPERAEQVIRREMADLGAARRDGTWHYQGEPVVLKLLIRTEDTRREVGDYVANQLEGVGFAVDRLYRTADQAAPLWLGADPAAGQWHLYTGGWVSTVINRDQAQNFADFYTPQGRPAPLWQAYDPPPALDRLARRLERRDYASPGERNRLMAAALGLAMESSVRIWLVDQLSLWPHAADVRVAADLAGGLAGSSLWPYTLRFEDRLGGEVIIATPSLLTDPWNPVAGTNWLYDRMIINATQDPPALPDPFTGLFRPQRIRHAEVTVAEGAPVQRSLDWVSLETASTITVPPEAWIGFDAGDGTLVTVGERHPDGLEARTRTRITFEEGYLDRRWHDGAPMSVADLMLPWLLQFARADEASPLFDRSAVPGHEAYLEHFRGWRIVAREPLTVEVYSDQIYPDAETIAAMRTPGLLPWHVLGLGIRAETAGELAFSSDKADRRRIPWLSLVSGPSLPILDRHRHAARNAGYVPFGEVLAGFTLADGPARRYEALDAWRDTRGHYWVGDGPFFLESVHAVAGSLVLARDEDFPDPADKWLRFAEVAIPEPAVDGPITVDLDQAARFRLEITAGGEPYPVTAIREVSWLLFDGTGALAHQGGAEPRPGGWRIRVPAAVIAGLGAGANRLEVIVRSHRVALPRFASHVFATIPAEAEGQE